MGGKPRSKWDNGEWKRYRVYIEIGGGFVSSRNLGHAFCKAERLGKQMVKELHERGYPSTVFYNSSDVVEMKEPTE